MKGRKCYKWLVTTVVVAVIICLGLFFYGRSMLRAEQRVKSFVHVINYEYKTPEKMYKYFTKAYRQEISKAEFVEAFNKERSYPYLTPLFLNYESIEMDKNNKSGVAIFSQAARLPGMIVEIDLVYENGDYYVHYFEEFLDGSYLDKFERLDVGGE